MAKADPRSAFMTEPMSFFYFRRQRCPHAQHLQWAEGDHQPWGHGPGRHPQFLPSLPAVHTTVHPGGGAAEPERKAWPQHHQEHKEVRQNHTDRHR